MHGPEEPLQRGPGGDVLHQPRAVPDPAAVGARQQPGPHHANIAPIGTLGMVTEIRDAAIPGNIEGNIAAVTIAGREGGGG